MLTTANTPSAACLALQMELRAKDALASTLDLDGRYASTVLETTAARPGVALIFGWDIKVFPTDDGVGFTMFADKAGDLQEFFFYAEEVSADPQRYFTTFAYAMLVKRVGPHA